MINFILTTLRNCLIGSPIESAEEIQRHNGCMILISALLHRHSDRQMNFLADCLLRLALFNTTAQVNQLIISRHVSRLMSQVENWSSFYLTHQSRYMSNRQHSFSVALNETRDQFIRISVETLAIRTKMTNTKDENTSEHEGNFFQTACYERGKN